MRVKPGIRDKLKKTLVILLFVAGGLNAFFWYLPLIRQNQRYRKEILELDVKLADEERLAKHLKASTDALLRDPNMLERLAREKLGFARTNETVIRFEPPERFKH